MCQLATGRISATETRFSRTVIARRRGRSMPRRSPGEIFARLQLIPLLGVCCTLVMLGGWGLTSAAMAARSELTIVSSDESGIRFSLDDLQASWTLRSLREGSLVLHELHIPGFINSGEPMQPSLPQKSGWVIVPPGTRATVVVIEEIWAAAGSRRLMVGPTPVFRLDPETGAGIPGEEILLPGETPRTGGTIPGDIAESLPDAGKSAVSGPTVRLGEVVPWRGRRIISYTITPVQTDATGRATRVLERGTWEIRFLADAKAGSEPGVQGSLRKRTSRGDDRFGFMFLNGNLLPRLLPEAASGLESQQQKLDGADEVGRRTRSSPARQATLLAPEIKIPIRRTLLYKVVASELRDRGLLPATPIGEDQIRLYQRRFSPELADQRIPYIEVEVPILMVGAGDDFSGGDHFLFYGMRPRDDRPYTSAGEQIPGCGDPEEGENENNIYWLAAAEPAGAGWARMDVISFSPSAGSPVPSYRRTDHIESDNHYREHVEVISADRNHFNSAFSGEIVASATVYTADPSAGNAILRAGVHGYANLRTDQSRWLDLYLGPQGGEEYLGAVNARLVTETIFESSLTGAQLQNETVNLRIRSQSGAFYISSFLDWFELSYDALFVVNNDRLLFNGGEVASTRDLEITGFTNTDIGLLEITEPHQPVWISLTPANLVAAGGGLTTLSIQVPQPDGQRTFYATGGMTGNGVSEVLYYLAETVPLDQDPTAVTAEPDLVVITHPEFRAVLSPWIQHRQERTPGGLEVHVVEVQDIFDWYSGGLKSVAAIGHFVSYAVDAWGSWALQLVGDANENIRALGQPAQSPDYYNDPTDWVSTHLHVQSLNWPYQPELLMSDEWFALPDNIRALPYPSEASVMPQMYVGRFPCNTATELGTMIAKVQAYEPAPANASWRRKGIFLADDAWSYGYANDAGQTMSYSSIEMGFRNSEDTLATWWDESGLEAVRLFLNDYLDPYVVSTDSTRDTAEFRDYTRSDFWPVLVSAANAGATILHFQGHANAKVMAHEYIVQDRAYGRRDVNDLNNNGRPWIFFGLGCHLSEWAQNPVLGTTIVEPSLGEKFLLRPQSGAIASYASSGYEFLTDNRIFSEEMLERWLFNPPAETVSGASVRSRWMLGELLWASEADLLARQVARYRNVVAQYGLLGDPLLMLDTGPPEVVATLADAGGQILNDQDELLAVDASNLRALRFATRDIGGIDRLVIAASPGPAIAPQVTETLPDGASHHQEVVYDVELPIRPLDHRVTFDVFDTSNLQPADDHYQLTVRVPQTAEFFDQDSNPLELGQIVFVGENYRTLRVVVRSAADLTPYPPEQMELTGSNLEVEDVQITPRPDEPHLLDLEFTARAASGTEAPRAVVLAITNTASGDVYETEYVLQEGEGPALASGISNLIAFPSPMRDETRFLFESDTIASGRIHIFSVAGRQVVTLEISPRNFTEDNAVVPWDGRDAGGDRLANGVYLYRVELDGPVGKLTSGVQRLVVMH